MDRLIAAASPPLSDADPTFDVPGADGLSALLARKNGFYAFESALHVYPAAPVGVPGRSLAEWNAPDLWKAAYGELAPVGICFAEDIFGGQFVLAVDGTVDRFDHETGRQTRAATSVAEWVALVLADYNYQTGYSAGHEWQIAHGALRVGHRLTARIPFVVGGEFAAGNLVEVDAAAAMNYWGGFARRVAGVPDGAELSWDVSVVDTLTSPRTVSG
ncbi:hypothetical protein Ais01nite_66030 [Asanoa ishikariensis]|uniref:SMI1/KNR4 family protein n=1 Tax=Asanoa ishikariensis TaxID=137265 RepID=A0A1H3NJN8_9ACTN|nr:hypothetical protein [Asanoa ishikariensis]GIF68568.1 hypothetical protein Ais01nite_66030 [Asanoa ishikariensis]SDY89147.1 hypothetical protein SAMN05421684_2121 [Asanoa ishikariensis]